MGANDAYYKGTFTRLALIMLGLLLLCIGVSFLLMPIAGCLRKNLAVKKFYVLGLCMGVEIIILSMLPNIPTLCMLSFYLF